MKMWCSCLLAVSVIVLSGCMSTSVYKTSVLRHHAYATGAKRADAAEWRALVPEFQRVIDMDPHGPSADDAQYAIASSWLWCLKSGETGALQHAIETFQKLIRTYPGSTYVPLAHYWLGRCYAHAGDDYQAILNYRVVDERYARSVASEPAQLELARAYAKQGYNTRAKTFYKRLIQLSANPDIAAASKELEALETQQKREMHVQKQPQNRPEQRAQPAATKPLAPESLTREFGLTARTVVIDPGHGGTDPGALGSGAQQEKGIVLSISQKLREILVARGYTVRLTRDTNHYIPLKARTAFATEHKADLFVSIHANAAKSPDAHGIETYYLDVNSTDETSEALAARENTDSGYSIQELETLLRGLIRESKSGDSQRLAEQVQRSLVRATGAVDRGVKHARFVVLIGTTVPAILIEVGFMSNPTEGQKLATSVYQDKVATAIAEGIDQFLGKTAGTPLVQISGRGLTAKGNEGHR